MFGEISVCAYTNVYVYIYTYAWGYVFNLSVLRFLDLSVSLALYQTHTPSCKKSDARCDPRLLPV